MSNKQHITGTDELLKKLEAFDFAVTRKILRKAIAEALWPVMLRAEKNALQRVGPNSSGLLSAAMDTKIKVYGKQGKVVGLVGPNADVVGVRVSGKKTKKHWPMKVAHLVEMGHINAKGKRVPPYPFLRPAWDATKKQAESILAAEVERGIAEEVK